jgi:uncharacterized delta-60 repeat protein
MLLQPDGKIVVSGGFYQIMDGSGSPPARTASARFSSSGLLDNTFIPALGFTTAAMVLQPNGKILIGGNFTKGAARLNPDGTLDTTFNLGSWWFGNQVYAILRQATGKAILGGQISYNNGHGLIQSLPRIFAGPPNFNPGNLLLLLLSD